MTFPFTRTRRYVQNSMTSPSFDDKVLCALHRQAQRRVWLLHSPTWSQSTTDIAKEDARDWDRTRGELNEL